MLHGIYNSKKFDRRAAQVFKIRTILDGTIKETIPTLQNQILAPVKEFRIEICCKKLKTERFKPKFYNMQVSMR